MYVGTAAGTVVALRLPDTSPGAEASTLNPKPGLRLQGEPSGENTSTEAETPVGAEGGNTETGEVGGVEDAGDALTGSVASTLNPKP